MAQDAKFRITYRNTVTGETDSMDTMDPFQTMSFDTTPWEIIAVHEV